MELPLFCITFLIVPVLTWNVDTRMPITFSGSKDSYFGYSVALHDNSKGPYAVVSATRANSTSRRRKHLHQPGVVYKCDITTSHCAEITLQMTADASFEGTPLSYQAKEDDMWLGVSLDVQTAGKGYILACGHLWKNKRYINHYLANGACYTIDREFRRSSYKALLPLVHTEKQTIRDMYYYAYGTAGLSATFVENTNTTDILMGAPGVYDWIGTVVSYSIHEDPRYAVVPIVPDPPSDEQITPAAYLGYSVTTGRFFKFGRVQFATGAPRDGDHKGRAYIFESLHHNKRNMAVLQRFQGEQVGEYFGSCVVGIDINGDTFTDLFVGSPFYSLQGLGDEGRVYVYMSNGVSLLKHRELMGSKKPRSRFGTTIANVGDLNQDGQTDVAIGAPYEDDQGAIYIYHGNSEGLDGRYKQRIAAKSINPSLSGFGISISKGKDIDGNRYPDILVGSYASDNAMLFRARPLVKVFGNITFDPPQIDTNISRCTWNYNSVPCFRITFCLFYKGSHLPDEIGLSTELTSARQRDGLQVRRYLEKGGALTSFIRQDMNIAKNTSLCNVYQAYVVVDSKDYITPIQMTLSFKLSHNVAKEKSFCKSCPMLHPNSPSTINGTITFQTGCGEDGICASDLNLTVNVIGLSSGDLIVGQDNVITLSIELQNFEEPAYNTDIYVHIPADVQIINQDSCENKLGISEQPAIVCRAGNPLVNGHVAKFDMKLDTSRVSTQLRHLVISVNVTTASQDVDPVGNEIVIEVPVKTLADVTIFGNSVVGEVILGRKPPEMDEPYHMVHMYTVLKYLPSPIQTVEVEFLVPTTTRANYVNFLQLNSVEINEGNSRASVPAKCSFTTTDGPHSSTFIKPTPAISTERTAVIIPVPRRKRSGDNETGAAPLSPDRPRNYVLDCNTSTCTRVSCTAGPFKDTNLAANFRIYSSLNVTSLEAILHHWDSFPIVTEGKVRIKDEIENVQPINHRPDEAQVFTMIHYRPPLPVRRVQFWIITFSVAVGILLLLLISLALIKVGFFQRKEKIKMKKMMLRAEVERMDPFIAAGKGAQYANGAVVS